MSRRLSSDAAEGLLVAVGTLLKAQGLYPVGHASVQRAEQGLGRVLRRLLADGDPLLFGRAHGYLVVGDVPFLRGSRHAADLLARLERRGVEGVVLAADARGSDVALLCRWLREEGEEAWDHPRIRLTRLATHEGAWPRARRVYRTAVEAVEEAYRESQEGRIPDANRARTCVEAFSELIADSPEILPGLVLIKDYDRYTFHHSVNVCLLSLGLARSLGLSAAEQECAGVGALLHDIGKTRTPAEIVRKPGPLSGNEWSLMWQHPEHGRDILREMGNLPPPTAQVVFEHHMRHDGGGYPKRPAGSRTHPLSPLVTVADVYDAMTTHRSYSLPKPLPEAVQTMAQLRGSHFAPAALDAFLALMGRIPVGSVVRLVTGEVAVVSGRGEGGGEMRVRPVLRPDGRSGSRADGDRDVFPDQVVHWVDPLAHGIDPARILAGEDGDGTAGPR